MRISERIGLLLVLPLLPAFIIVDQLYCKQLGTTDTLLGSLHVCWSAWLDEWNGVNHD